MTDRDRKFADAARVVEESAVMRTIARIAAAAIPPSPKASADKAGWTYGITIAAGLITHALLLQLMPDRLAPVKPMAYWMAVAFVAFAVAAGFITNRSDNTASADSAAGTANTTKS